MNKAGITANQITITSIVLSFSIGISFWYGEGNRILFLALPAGLFIRMALNALDGMMARIYDQQSKTGEVLNELGDIVSDTVIFIPLLKYEPHILLFIVAFLCLSIINEFTGLLAKVVSGERRYDGPMGKSDRAFVMGVYGLICFFEVEFRDYSLWIFLTINLLLVISTFVRIRKSIR